MYQLLRLNSSLMLKTHSVKLCHALGGPLAPAQEHNAPALSAFLCVTERGTTVRIHGRHNAGCESLPATIRMATCLTRAYGKRCVE